MAVVTMEEVVMVEVIMVAIMEVIEVVIIMHTMEAIDDTLLHTVVHQVVVELQLWVAEETQASSLGAAVVEDSWRACTLKSTMRKSMTKTL